MQKSRFPVRKLVIFLIIALALTGLVSALVMYLNGPSSSEPVTYVPPDFEQAELDKERELKAKHFQLQYQSTLDTVSDISGGDKNALEIYRLSSSGLENRRRMVATIKPMPTEGYAGESSYLLRKKDPGKYSEQALNIGGSEFVVFVETNGNEQTAFTSSGGKLAMLAYTMSVPDADPKAEFEALLAGFKWIN